MSGLFKARCILNEGIKGITVDCVLQWRRFVCGDGTVQMETLVLLDESILCEM